MQELQPFGPYQRRLFARRAQHVWLPAAAVGILAVIAWAVPVVAGNDPPLALKAETQRQP
jgi:hypothetical protein